MPRHSEATLAAVKQAVDIVAFVGENLPLHRSGSKFKVLCPFHDDHNPSLELNPERQSFKCWVCGAGGDVIEFTKGFFRVDFPEAVQMLAERAGMVLENPSAGPAPKGPSKTDLMAVNEWARGQFAEALGRSGEVMAYVAERGISPESVARFRLGYAPDVRDWLSLRARKAGYSSDLLEKAGLVVRSKEQPGLTRERFRGRLMFPIHDPRGRTLGFGGRILPQVEKSLAAEGKNIAKYLNSSETRIFQKRRVLYAADLALSAARDAGWVAVVEGYTDVIAAHQAGLANVVGTLGTALGDDHVVALRRLADRVVLVFDGDDAGQAAADRSLELFLAHEVDVRVLTLPAGIDPCDFLRNEGAEAFRALVERAVDPMAFAIDRAEARFDLSSPEESRRAAEWVLSILARVPKSNRVGMDIKTARALDTLSQRLHVPLATLERALRQYRRQASTPPRSPAVLAARTGAPGQGEAPEAAPRPPIRTSDLDPTDRQLVEIALNHPDVVRRLIARVAIDSIRDAALRAILQASYDLHGEGATPTFDRVVLRLEDPAHRALAAGLLLPLDPAPMSESARPAPWEERLAGIFAQLDYRDWKNRVRELNAILNDPGEVTSPEELQALQLELRRLAVQRPDTKKKSAS